MKTLILNDITVLIPDAWNDVLLKHQLNVDRFSIENPEYKTIAIIAGYTGLTIEQVKHLHINDVKKLLQELAFIKEPMKNEPISEFEFKGEKYNVTATLLRSEFQDFLSIETLLENYKGKEYQALPFIIAVLAKKEDESLDDYDLSVRAKHFEDLPLTVANDIYFFFALIGLTSLIDSRKVLKDQNLELTESINSMKNTLKKPSGGVKFSLWQKVILQSYLQYLERGWKKYYGGFNLDQEKDN